MGCTALHLAVRGCLYETADFLVNTCGVRVNVKNKMDHSPLHIAVLNDQLRIAKMLVDAKIDVLMISKEGLNCHEQAQKMEFEEMTQYLDPVIVLAEIWQ